MKAAIHDSAPMGKLSVGLIFCGLAFFLIAPLLISRDLFGSDAPVHVRWQMAFAREFWSGTVFPRWLPAMNRGFGSPAFFFYPPALQWLGAVFAPLLPGDAGAIRRLALGLAVVFVIGAQGCRCWIRALGGSDTASLVGGCLWLASPYLAFVDVYQRGAFAECASFALLPWLGFSAVRVCRGDRHAWGFHAIAIAALAYAHMPGMVIGYLFAAAHGLALIGSEVTRRRRIHLMLALGTSALTGLAIAGAMLVPALGLLGDIVDPTAMSGERNQPHNWLLFSHTPWIDHTAWIMTMGLWVLILIVTTILAPGALSAPARRPRCVAWAMVAAVAAVSLLNLEISLPLWQLHTPLSRIQFPFRLFGASSLAVAILAGLAYDIGRTSRTRLRVITPWLVLGGMLAIDAGAMSYQRLRPRLAPPSTLTEIAANTDDSSEYILGDLPDAAKAFGNRLVFAPNARAGQILKVAHAEILNRHLALDYSADSNTAVALHQFLFSGWECRIDGGIWTTAQSLRLGPSPMPAKVSICQVPGGAHHLEARMPEPLPETIGVWLSVIGAALVIGSFYRSHCAPA